MGLLIGRLEGLRLQLAQAGFEIVDVLFEFYDEVGQVLELGIGWAGAALGDGDWGALGYWLCSRL